ncbi:MAG: 1-acyl-sn-glycerol-3-phosphate acyltransferase [Treponemataceae bacterium]|nr:1-acyl-sn-glycerol-3-phosphate acyltransferase [Treponemataceae bacterium]
MQNEHIVKDGVFIPQTGIEYPEKPDQRMVPLKKVRDVKVDENYPYLMKSFTEKFYHFLVYLGIFVIVFPLQKIRYGLKIEGRKNITRNKKLLKNGAITVCNHVYRWDYLAVLQAARFRHMWFPTFADNMNGTDMRLIRSAGGIPIPESGFSAIKKFNESFDTLHARKKWIHIFPETCRWQWYQPIRPFKTGAFSMAYRYDLPVIPMVLKYRPVTGWRKLFKMDHPLVTICVGEPIVPNLENSRKAESARICKEAHEKMCEMAGIEQNGWDPILEEKPVSAEKGA